MATFSQKSRDVLEGIGLNNQQINSLQQSQTFVSQLNNHTERANVNYNSSVSGFGYKTTTGYGDIYTRADGGSIAQLDTLIHELGHANNVDLVQRVDWPTSPVDYPNATDLSMSEYIYHTMINEGAAELNRNEIINELNQHDVLDEFPGLNMDSCYDPNKSRDEMIKELGENYINDPKNQPASIENNNTNPNDRLTYPEQLAYDWLKNKNLLPKDAENWTNQDRKDLLKNYQLFNLDSIKDIKDLIENLKDWLGDKFNDWFDGLNRDGTYYVYDPLVLDLDGDGVELISENNWNGVLFDFNGNGIKTATQWVSSDDGLLVWDRNGNGKIDNGSELFGEDTIKISANDEFFTKYFVYNFQVA